MRSALPLVLVALCLTLGLHGTLGARSSPERQAVERVRVGRRRPRGRGDVRGGRPGGALALVARRAGRRGVHPSSGWGRGRPSATGPGSDGYRAPARHPFPDGPLVEAHVEVTPEGDWLVLRRPRRADVRLDVTGSSLVPASAWRLVPLAALTPIAMLLDVALCPFEAAAIIIWLKTYDGPWP